MSKVLTFTVAGIPAKQWGAGIRLWLAMMLALYVAFWLQLEGASSAAISVGIIFQQTRGAAVSKAFWRLTGTIVGVAASVTIAGLFNGASVPFFAAVAIWIGGCVALSSSLHGDRAYGAVLSGYTVAIVAVANVDAPLNIFLAGINRGGAIMVGVLAVFVVNDVFRTPDVFPALRKTLSVLQSDVLDHVRSQISHRGQDLLPIADLLRRIAGQKSSIAALAAEYPRGRARSWAARRAVWAMLALLYEARRQSSDRSLGSDTPLVRSLGLAMNDLDGRLIGAEGPPLPVFRSLRNAAWSGLRVGLGMMVAAWACAMCGWPQTSVVILQVGALLGLSATMPDPPAFAGSLLTTVPCAILVAAFTQFVVLGGSDSFPLLMAAMAPPIIGGGMLAASGRPALVGSGTLVVIFTPVLLSLSNPQSYNPLAFLTLSFTAMLASVIVFVILTALFPVGAERHLHWIFQSARNDLRKVIGGRTELHLAAGWLHRDADRLGQAGLLVQRGAGSAKSLRDLFRLSDVTAAALQLLSELQGVGVGNVGVSMARQGLRDLDPKQLARAAGFLAGTLPEAAAAAERIAILIGPSTGMPSKVGGISL